MVYGQNVEMAYGQHFGQQRNHSLGRPNFKVCKVVYLYQKGIQLARPLFLSPKLTDSERGKTDLFSGPVMLTEGQPSADGKQTTLQGHRIFSINHTYAKNVDT